MKIKVTNIEWCTDGKDIKTLGLPEEVIIEGDDLKELIDEYDNDIEDYLSDKYEFCIFSYHPETIGNFKIFDVEMTKKINFKIIAETEDEVMDFINCHDMDELKDDIDFTLSYEDEIIGSRPISKITEENEKDTISLYELEKLIDERD